MSIDIDSESDADADSGETDSAGLTDAQHRRVADVLLADDHQEFGRLPEVMNELEDLPSG